MELSLSNMFARKNIREELLAFEEQLKGQEGHLVGDSELCPLKHSFADGFYVREIFIPKGLLIIGKIHKHEHPNFLMSGVVEIVTEEGSTTLIGPCAMISPPGTKRALRSITDLVWITVHLNPTNTKDIAELEKTVIAESFEVYDKFRKRIESKPVSIWNKLIKKLTI
jgi:hypothetical protein